MVSVNRFRSGNAHDRRRGAFGPDRHVDTVPQTPSKGVVFVVGAGRNPELTGGST